jgi:hypothetical protein
MKGEEKYVKKKKKKKQCQTTLTFQTYDPSH